MPIWHIKFSQSSFDSRNMKSLGTRPAFLFTALFSAPVATPYSAARLVSSKTLSPRMKKTSCAKSSDLGPVVNKNTRQSPSSADS
jgi:hypothetical protein